MSDFKGITQDTLFLMQLNRFNDSKAFYEENKEKIKANMTVPMRQIAASLSDMMLDIDHSRCRGIPGGGCDPVGRLPPKGISPPAWHCNE